MNKVLKKYSSYLNEINIMAYKNVYMLSNPTLSKNPYTKTRFLHNLLDAKINKYSFFKNILLFYIKNILLFIFFLIPFFYVKLFFRKEKITNEKEVRLIDSFYGDAELNNKILKKDKYFEKLYEYMNINKITYYHTPKFYGNKNPLKYIKFYKILKRSEQKYFIDLDYLTFNDLGKIIIFIMSYPWQVFLLKKSIKSKKNIDIAFKEDLSYSLSGTDFYPYIRYLYARNLSKELKNKKIKVISWCEYQVVDKNFFNGIRTYSKSITIYATQFLFKFPTYSCLYIPESDKDLGIAPDKILVTGQYYVVENSNYEYKIGPALRYEKLYNTQYFINKNSLNIVVMLPYVQEDALSLVELLKESDKFCNMEIDFKLHPDFIHETAKYKTLFSVKWKIINAYPDLEKYGFVISSGSGSVMELASVGMSVIITASKNSFTTNPMPAEGKNENWSLVFTSTELEDSFQQLLKFKQDSTMLFEKNIVFYRENFLSKVDDATIKENFDF